MTYSACNTKTIKVLSNIFSVDFCEHCATIATTKRQKISEQGNGEKSACISLCGKPGRRSLLGYCDVVYDLAVRPCGLKDGIGLHSQKGIKVFLLFSICFPTAIYE